jgi:hypothetical protein
MMKIPDLFRRLRRGSKPFRPFRTDAYMPQVSELVEISYGSIVDIRPGECAGVIENAVADDLGKDFFYSYFLNPADRTLRYVAFKSKRWLAGKVPVFAPALANPGTYSLSIGHGDHCRYLVIDTVHGVVIRKRKNLVDTDLAAVALSPSFSGKPQAPSLRLRWSRAKRSSRATMMAACLALACAMLDVSAGYLATVRQERLAEVEARTRQVEKSMSRLPSLLSVISRVETMLSGTGQIALVLLTPEGLKFRVKFDDVSKASIFKSKIGTGGVLEGTTVTYTAPVV